MGASSEELSRQVSISYQGGTISLDRSPHWALRSSLL